MDFIKRKLYKEIKEHLSKREITIIIGPRQVGKTTLMHNIEKELASENKPTLFLDLDRELHRRYFASQELFLQKLRLEFGENKGYVFIDEFQRKEDASLFLKGIYDMNLPYKFIVSGSGSLELKERVHESLSGRKRIFELMPISLYEFIQFRTGYKYEQRLSEFFLIEKEALSNLLTEYMNYGGYPRVILEESEREKRIVIDEIFHSYLEKDISYLLRVERIDAFSELIRLIAHQIGQVTNYSALSTNLNISLQTLKNYIYYAEKTFIIRRITPYFNNPKKEIVKMPIFYFCDLGLRNYSIALFGTLFEYGFVFENLIFNILKDLIKFTGVTIHFWRTKQKAEVDFILRYENKVLPIEVKYKKFKKPQIERALRSFIERYNPELAVIINLELDTSLEIGETKVVFWPFYKLLTYNSIFEMIDELKVFSRA